jgi:hypothetical protein
MRARATTVNSTKLAILIAVSLMLLSGSPLIHFVGAAHAPQLKEMIQNGDHAGLAEFYKKRAEEARHNAADMKTMASEYLKKYPKNTYAKHCEKMENRYLEEAKDYEALTEMHSKAAQSGGK